MVTKFDNKDLNNLTKAQLILHINELYNFADKVEVKTKKSRIHVEGVDKHYGDYYKETVRIMNEEGDKE